MGLSMVAVFLFSGTMSTSGIVVGQRHLWNVIPLFVSFAIYADRGRRRDQPGAVRPARGRVRAGRRLPHRVLVVQVRDVLPGRVHQHGHRLGAGRRRCSSAAGGRRGRCRCGTAPTRAGGRCSGSSSRSILGIFVFVWLRGTLPRLRYDQFMRLGWKVLIPINLVWILAVTVDPRAARPQLGRRGRPPSIPLAVVLLVIVVPALMVLRGRHRAPGRRTCGRGGRGRRTRPDLPDPADGPGRPGAATTAASARHHERRSRTRASGGIRR